MMNMNQRVMNNTLTFKSKNKSTMTKSIFKQLRLIANARGLNLCRVKDFHFALLILNSGKKYN